MALCILCAKQGRGGRNWFLLVENRCQDKLRVLRWEPHLAGQADVHSVCSAEHVLELVVHWMTTGSVEYPFARFGPDSAWNSRTRMRQESETNQVPAARGVALGELSIDRTSVQRLLSEKPECLHVILRALLEALEFRSDELEVLPGDDAARLYTITHRA